MSRHTIQGEDDHQKNGGIAVNDKEKVAWQTTIAHYHAWNDAIFQSNIRNAGKKPPLQKWQEFLAMMEFGLLLKPSPSEHEQRQKVDMFNQYYEQMLRFGVRRAQDGKSV